MNNELRDKDIKEYLNQLKEAAEVYGDIFCPPIKLLRELFNFSYEFAIIIPQYESDEEPPLDIKEDSEIIPIDKFLGIYLPKEKKIIIFKKGIEEASKIINCDVKFLNYIVELHEWSHAFFHVGVDENIFPEIVKDENLKIKCLKKATRLFNSIEEKLHEILAQLLTYHSLVFLSKKFNFSKSCEIVERIIKVFFELNKYQPYYYKINNYLDVPTEKIIRSIILLKKRFIKGTFEAWDMVVKL